MAADNKLTVQDYCSCVSCKTLKKAVIVCLVTLCAILLPQETSASSSQSIRAIEDNLRAHGFGGPVYPIHTYPYEKYRKVKNGACNVLYPLIIIRPVSTKDVAIGIQVATSMHLPVSVRSGGHGYLCNNIKNGSLHFDLRKLNKVQLLPQRYGQVKSEIVRKYVFTYEH